MKTCKKCGVGYETKRCNPCAAAYMRAWLSANPEKARLAAARRKQWDLDNPGRTAVNGQRWRQREENSTIARERASQWYRDNKDQAKETNRAYYEAHKEAIANRNKNWSAQNINKVRQAQFKWKQQNPEKMRVYDQNRRVRRYTNTGRVSGDVVSKLYKAQKGMKREIYSYYTQYAI